jgi:hypothetical protein
MGKLTDSEFAGIVNSVAGSMSDVVSVSIFGFDVDVTFRSNSGKTKWNSYLKFDEQTGHYSYTSPYLGAASPWLFGNDVQSRIQGIISSQ